ncbi:hypothetical protein GH714_022088 [Hevea brasiliensis]|uniref:DDE Tnp4 domain-containing protein n=1 Tax=Hevea brasiliensis TaxID=3981 RepID=A0A6A6KTT0_HEVBR|nr:hypothetical protein GH714_022088 [Hevea brasiliensis]
MSSSWATQSSQREKEMEKQKQNPSSQSNENKSAKAKWQPETLENFIDICAKPLFEKFRNQRIPTRLLEKYDILFVDTVATGEHAWAPSIGVLLDDDDDGRGDNIEKAHSEDAIRLEGTGDSEEESNFLKDLDQRVNNEIQGTQRMRNDSPATEQIQGKKGKRVDMSSKQGKKDNKAKKKMKTQSSGSAKLSEQIDRLVATVERRGTITSKKNDLPGCTIPVVYEQLNALPEIEEGNELWLFATEFLEIESKREMFASIKKPEPIDLEFSDTPSEILNDRRYMPHFKDCIGAIDGTHVRGSIAPEEQIPYIGRKGIQTQNIMAACGFDM